MVAGKPFVLSQSDVRSCVSVHVVAPAAAEAVDDSYSERSAHMWVVEAAAVMGRPVLAAAAEVAAAEGQQEADVELVVAAAMDVEAAADRFEAALKHRQSHNAGRAVVTTQHPLGC